MRISSRKAFVIAFVVAIFGAQAAFAGGHTWRVKEVFSNADGTIQYIETWEAMNGAGEILTSGHTVSSNLNSILITADVAVPTNLKSLLFATQGFADLGVVTPDYIITPSFFSRIADSITYSLLDTMTFTAGQLPLNGYHALDRNFKVVVNSPENYAGIGGTIDVSTQPPGVPAQGGVPLTVNKTVAGGSQLQLTFDTAACFGDIQHQVIHGFGSGLPATPGGTFTLGGAVCSIGGGSPFEWLAVPDPSIDSTQLLWFIVQATNGTLEGSWGKDSNVNERVGPGLNGSSGECGMTDKDLSNTCGQ